MIDSNKIPMRKKESYVEYNQRLQKWILELKAERNAMREAIGKLKSTIEFQREQIKRMQLAQRTTNNDYLRFKHENITLKYRLRNANV